MTSLVESTGCQKYHEASHAGWRCPVCEPIGQSLILRKLQKAQDWVFSKMLLGGFGLPSMNVNDMQEVYGLTAVVESVRCQ